MYACGPHSGAQLNCLPVKHTKKQKAMSSQEQSSSATSEHLARHVRLNVKLQSGSSTTVFRPSACNRTAARISGIIFVAQHATSFIFSKIWIFEPKAGDEHPVRGHKKREQIARLHCFCLVARL